MSKIAIVFYSGYGHTKKQAYAVAEGAGSVEGTSVSIVEIPQDGNLPTQAWTDLAEQDALIFGSPTYMGGPSWQFKKFADESSKQWASGAWFDKIAAGFTNSAAVNGDKFLTISYFITLAQQHGQIWVGTGLKPSYEKTSGPDDINWTGGFSGALAISPSDASSEEAPRRGDLETAKHLGKRVAELAKRFVR